MNDILQLKRQGLSLTEIAALTGFNRRTIRKYLALPQTPRYGPRVPRPTKLDPFKPFLEERLAGGVWNAAVLFRDLKQRGYEGGYTTLKDYLAPKRRAAREVAVRRFETPPGHQAQVDWGHLGELKTPDGKQNLSCFVLTLGHSRAMFAEVTTDQTLPTFLRLHEAAFRELGGVPHEILYDRVKTVVLGQDERGETRWHPIFAEFARYWGFIPRLCRAYRPQTKGKVEAGIGYVRKNFLCGCQATDLLELRCQFRAWVAGTANQRIHGTTHQCVAVAWEAEKPHLQPVGSRLPYPLAPQQVRKVARDAFVSYRSNRYSVPWQAAGQEVFVREVDGYLEILRDEARLARHRLCTGRHQVQTLPGHHVGLPLADSRRRRKAMLTLEQGAPTVEVRPLAVYEAFAAATVASTPLLAAGGGA